MEDNRTRSIGGCPESFESENSSELPALVMITDIHSSPEMPSSSSSNERAKNKADAKGKSAVRAHVGIWWYVLINVLDVCCALCMLSLM